jgi:predicted transcriptional regulator/ABC-type dipeptide/oligopeptide/nickel transport system ATPase subunit
MSQQLTREKVLDIIRQNPGIGRLKIAEMTNTPSPVVKKLLEGLKAEGLLVWEGILRGTKYSLTETGRGTQAPAVPGGQPPMDENHVVPANPMRPKLDINKRFNFMTKLVKVVARGHANGMIITGQGGTGKTNVVLETLAELGLEPRSPGEVVIPEKHYLHVKGATASTDLYRTLFENHEALIIFDDCDSALHEGNGMNILKTALDTYEVRRVSWTSPYVQNVLGLPESFEFKGRVIFISNLKVINQALMSRCLNVDLNMTPDELVDRMDAIGMKMVPEVSEAEHEEIINHIREHKDQFSDLSLRTYLKTANLVISGEEEWKDLAIFAN